MKVLITDTACVGAAGEGAGAHYAALRGALSATASNPVVTAPGPDGRHAPAVSAPTEWIEGDEPVVRVTELLKAALQTLALPGGEGLLIEIALPGEDSCRGRGIHPEWLGKALQEHVPTGATLELVPAEGLIAERLARRAGELSEGRWQSVVFGGVDSQIDPPSLLSWAREGRLLTAGGQSGRAPGEGAALLRLESARSECPALARLAGLAHAAEPHHRQAEARRVAGLAQAIEQALKAAGHAAASIDSVWLGLGAERWEALEWHQTVCALWPGQLAPDMHHALELGLLEDAEPTRSLPEPFLLHRAFGDWGVAELPLALVLACEHLRFQQRWRDYGFSAGGPALVCESGDWSARAAACLEPNERIVAGR